MRSLLLVACVVCAACTSVTPAPVQPPATSAVTASRVASPSVAVTGPIPSREPGALPVYPEEAAVTTALTAAGIRLTVIGASMNPMLFGQGQRARVFIEQPGGGGAGANVHFLDPPVSNIRVCLSKTAAGLNRSDIYIGDRLVGSAEGTQTVLYSVSRHYFVAAIGTRFSDALMSGLGTATPPC